MHPTILHYSSRCRFLGFSVHLKWLTQADVMPLQIPCVLTGLRGYLARGPGTRFQTPLMHVIFKISNILYRFQLGGIIKPSLESKITMRFNYILENSEISSDRQVPEFLLKYIKCCVLITNCMTKPDIYSTGKYSAIIFAVPWCIQE